MKYVAAAMRDPKLTSSSWLSVRPWTRCLKTWSRGRRQPEFGLHYVSRERGTGDKPTLVVYVHGLNSRPEDLGLLVPARLLFFIQQPVGIIVIACAPPLGFLDAVESDIAGDAK